jgi:hypothetical protein
MSSLLDCYAFDIAKRRIDRRDFAAAEYKVGRCYVRRRCRLRRVL